MDACPQIKYERAPCPQCGARTEDEASGMCRQTSDETGEFSCAGEFSDGHSVVPTTASLAAIDAWIDRQMANEQ